MADFDIHPEYKNYNKVVITINPGKEYEYIISNYNTKGKPEYMLDAKSGLPIDKYGAHLQSLSIESPSYDSGNPSNIGAKGSITIVDYNDIIVKLLISHFKNYIAKVGCAVSDQNLASIKLTPNQLKNIDNSQLLPTIKIEISCYIGPTVTYEGHIIDWSTQFTGTTPSITLNWSVICPCNNIQQQDAPETAVNFCTSDPGEYYNAICNAYSTTKKVNVKIYDASGNQCGTDEKPDWSAIMPFGKKSSATDTTATGTTATGNSGGPSDAAAYGQTAQPTNYTRNAIINALYLICENSCFSVSLNPLIGYLSNDGNTFIIIEKDPEVDNSNNPDNSVAKGIIFVQNGEYSPYVKLLKENNEYTVVPMTSFSFNTSFNQLATQFNITLNPNGNTTSTNDGASATNTSAEQSANEFNALSKNGTASAISVKFDCYNIMTFNQNNVNTKIRYEVYNELGERHVSSGTATVTKVSYELSGAVIKASVEATQIFNAIVSNDPSNDNSLSIGDLQVVKPQPGSIDSNGKVNVTPLPDSNDRDYNIIEYLRSEDWYTVPLSEDKTLDDIASNKLNDCIITFLCEFPKQPSKWHNRNISLTLIRKILDNQYFGLLALILGFCAAGIKDFGYEVDRYLNSDDSDDNNDDFDGEDLVMWFRDMKDPALLYAGYANSRPEKWFAADRDCSNPYDVGASGLGIPHFLDGDALKDIYDICGFSPDLTQAEKAAIEKNFLDIPKTADDISKYTGKFVGWTSSETNRFIGLTNSETRTLYITNSTTRIYPEFNGTCLYKNFADALHEPIYETWAKQLINYQGTTGLDRPYQLIIFKLWISTIWNDTLNALREYNKQNGSARLASIQDAIRIACAATKDKSFINKMAGRTVEEQFCIYYGNDQKSLRQKAFHRRCADIVTWAYGDDTVKSNLKNGIIKDRPKQKDPTDTSVQFGDISADIINIPKADMPAGASFIGNWEITINGNENIPRDHTEWPLSDTTVFTITITRDGYTNKFIGNGEGKNGHPKKFYGEISGGVFIFKYTSGSGILSTDYIGAFIMSNSGSSFSGYFDMADEKYRKVDRYFSVQRTDIDYVRYEGVKLPACGNDYKKFRWIITGVKQPE